MNLKDCLEQGFLKKTEPDTDKANNSLRLAEHKLDNAKINLDSGAYEDAFVNAYSSMFHAARFIMWRDGYKERGHFVLSIFLKEFYGDKIELKYINELGTLRSIRHEVIYGKKDDASIREVQETEAASAIKIARGFLEVGKKLIKQK